MATQVKHRRGTSSEIAAFTPAIGELIMNTDTNELILGDGATTGGHIISNHKQVDTVAALKSRPFRPGDLVSTKGYYAAGDDGAATYLIAANQSVDGYGDHLLTNSNVALLVDDRSNLNYGCVADGVANDTLALQALDAAGGGVIKKGIVRVQASISLVADYSFEDGGIIAPDSSYTITWTGTINAGDYKIFDGNFGLTKKHRVDEVRITWFGAVSTDIAITLGQPGAVDDVTLANANAKAIRQANAMVNLGIPDGIYVTPILRIPTGIFIVDDDNNNGEIFNLDSYMTLLGNGWSSVVRPVDGAKAFSVVKLDTDGASNVIVDNFQIYGEASTQSNTQHGLDISPPSSPVIYSYVGRNLHIKEMNGNGIRVLGAGMDNSTIEPRLVRDSTLHNLYVAACDRLVVQKGIYRTAKSGNSGALFDSAGCLSAVIRHNQFDENNVHGLLVSNVNGRFNIYGNRASGNATGSGFFIDRCDNSDIVGNFAEQNAISGIVTDLLDNCTIDRNMTRSNGQHGMAINSTNNSSIQGNNSYGNSTSADNTYDGIFIGSNSDDNNVQGNTVRHLGGANQHKYGLEVNDAASGINLVTNNDLKNSGRTSSFFDNGGGTVTTAGNRL